MRPESQHVVVSADVAVVHAILDTSRAGKRGEAHTSIRVFTTVVWMRPNVNGSQSCDRQQSFPQVAS